MLTRGLCWLGVRSGPPHGPHLQLRAALAPHRLECLPALLLLRLSPVQVLHEGFGQQQERLVQGADLEEQVRIRRRRLCRADAASGRGARLRGAELPHRPSKDSESLMSLHGERGALGCGRGRNHRSEIKRAEAVGDAESLPCIYVTVSSSRKALLSGGKRSRCCESPRGRASGVC